MTNGGSTIDHAEIATDLERARAELHRQLDEAERNDAWTQPTRGTRWTNEQLLFHMVFGYMVVLRLLVLVRLFGRLPDPISHLYARALDAATTPFHAINYYGSCGAALVYNRRRMGAKFDRVIAALRRKLALENDDSFTRGMHFPPRWDPFFADYMTMADVYHYPGQHFDFHARQLALG
jgi:DinB family protein